MLHIHSHALNLQFFFADRFFFFLRDGVVDFIILTTANAFVVGVGVDGAP